MIPRRLLFPVGVLFLLPLGAAAAADDLLRLVPDDVGFCLVVEDPRGAAAQLFDSPFLEQLWRTPAAAALARDPNWQKLAQLQNALPALFGPEWPKLRDDVLGGSVALAYRPGPPGRADQEQGLVLVQARDAGSLAAVVDRLNEIQRGSGELKHVEAREHRGRTYYERQETKGKNYYYVRGPVLAFSSQEAMVRQAIDRDLRPAGDSPSEAARQLTLLFGATPRLARVWVNPRAFDAHILATADRTGKPEEAAAVKHFHIYWRALDAVGLAVNLTDRLEASLAVRARTSDLPGPARRALAEAAKPSELWQRFPDNALLAAACRLDLAAVQELLAGFLAPEARRTFHDVLDRHVSAALGKDFLKEVLPNVGPDWGLCVVAPEPGGESWVPQAVAAVRVRPGDRPPAVDQSLLSAVQFSAQLAVLTHNGKNDDRLSLHSVFQDQVEVRYLESAKRFPPDFRPSFALKGGYLVLATSPEAIRRFEKRPGPAAEGEVPLLRVSLKDLRQYMKARRQPLAAGLAKQNTIGEDVAGKQLDDLGGVLDLFDRLEVTLLSASGQGTLILRVQTAKPLRR